MSRPSHSTTAANSRRYLALVVGLLLLFFAVVEIFLRSEIPERGKRAALIAEVYTSSHRDLIMGDSSFEFAFRGVSDFANLSGRGSTTLEMEHLLRAYYSWRDPGRVILIASPGLFSRRRHDYGTYGTEEFFDQYRHVPFGFFVFEPGISQQLTRLGPLIPQWLVGRLPPHEPHDFTATEWAETSH